MILKGKETETQRKLKAFLAGGDTPRGARNSPWPPSSTN